MEIKEKLLKVINHYGVMHQLKYLQSEVFELNEAIIKQEYDKYLHCSVEDESLKEHIKEELADVYVMLDQLQYYYEIDDMDLFEVMDYKLDRQLERIKNETKKLEYCEIGDDTLGGLVKSINELNKEYVDVINELSEEMKELKEKVG
jgi:NTP pyrophosphatase (non-canonical NTP hydrolase)